MESHDKQLEGTTVDLSLDGMLVQSYLVFPVGGIVKVRLELPASSAPLQVEALVVRTIGTDRMGMQFKSLGVGERTRVQEFLLPLILADK